MKNTQSGVYNSPNKWQLTQPRSYINVHWVYTACINWAVECFVTKHCKLMSIKCFLFFSWSQLWRFKAFISELLLPCVCTGIMSRTWSFLPTAILSFTCESHLSQIKKIFILKVLFCFANHGFHTRYHWHKKSIVTYFPIGRVSTIIAMLFMHASSSLV